MCAPQPTPPKETSAASTSTNVSTAIANSWLSNFNEYTPDGKREFNRTGTQKVFDPYTDKTYKVPTFDVTTTLSRKQQRIKDQQDRAKTHLSHMAGDQAKFLRGYMDEPFQYGIGEHEDWAGSTYDRLTGEANARAEEDLASRLANQGIGIGSDAYSAAMRDLRGGQQTARDRFMLDSHRTGFDMAQASRNQPINEITALLSGSQVSAPAFSTQPNQVMMPTTDNAKIISDYDNARISAANANMGFAGGLFSTLLGAVSDERLKENKEKVGETKDGIGLYTFNFKGNSAPQFGMMAQEVEKKKPKAVTTGPDGIKRVKYREALK